MAALSEGDRLDSRELNDGCLTCGCAADDDDATSLVVLGTVLKTCLAATGGPATLGATTTRLPKGEQAERLHTTHLYNTLYSVVLASSVIAREENSRRCKQAPLPASRGSFPIKRDCRPVFPKHRHPTTHRYRIFKNKTRPPS